MKNMILTTMENVFNDLRAFFFTMNRPEDRKPSQTQPTPKIQEPNGTKRTGPQRMSAGTRKKSPSIKDQSMLDHTGVTKFKGSGYKGKGNVDTAKQTHNKKRR